MILDPTTTLETLRQAIRYDGPMTDADRIELLSRNFQALDDWLSKKGFPPAQWGNLTTREAAHEDAERRIQEIRRELTPDPWGVLAPPAQRTSLTRQQQHLAELQEELRGNPWEDA